MGLTTDPVNTQHDLHYRMDNITMFARACMDNKVIEVRRMKAEGMNINDKNGDGITGLMVAMSEGNVKASTELLNCNNIKIDIEDDVGNTALHWACFFNRVESVKLFLGHPDCKKDIVRLENKMGLLMNRVT